MNDIYQRLADRARKTPDSQFLALPVIPSLGMIEAAAEVRNVFREGDRLHEWFERYDDPVDMEDSNVNPELVARYGWNKAFAMTCIADMWGLAVQGVRFWLRDRSRNPFRANDGADLIHYLPVGCPDGGWPEDKSACTDAHKAHARCQSEPFATYWTAWQGVDDEEVVVAPRRLPAAAVSRLALSRVSAGVFSDLQDVVNLADTPYIPFWTRENTFDDEESYDLMFAAMWQGAVGWLLSEDRSNATPFPLHDDAQATVLTHLVFGYHPIWQKVENFIMGGPYDRVSVFTSDGLLTIAACDGRTSFWYREGEHRFIRNEGLVLGAGREDGGLSRLLAKVSKMDIVKVEALRLGSDWGSE